ncbi:MAG: PEP-CTERM sorting domain-containing protein [Sedimentisphaerales bacterium]|nr:PEP-CTERM sorting domain-containing protein [Sedimentisphaerales bacterium]
MKNMFLILMLLLLITAQSALANTYPYPLNCAGTYDENSDVWEHDFDLGVTFTEITQVSIQWSGEATAGIFIYNNPPGEVLVDSEMLATLVLNPGFATAVAGAGVAEYPDPEQFSCESIFTGLSPDEIATLLDGTGKIIIERNLIVTSIGGGSYLSHGEVSLNDATLIIEGTLVPEPTGMLMLLLGTTSLLRKNKDV